MRTRDETITLGANGTLIFFALMEVIVLLPTLNRKFLLYAGSFLIFGSALVMLLRTKFRLHHLVEDLWLLIGVVCLVILSMLVGLAF